MWASLLTSIALTGRAIAQNTTAEIRLTAPAVGFEPENTAFTYGPNALLIANDGEAATGGFRVFSVGSPSLFPEVAHVTTGRSKIATPVYGVDGEDYAVNIAATDSILRLFCLPGIEEIPEARKKALGDWSTMCSWKSSESDNQYVFLFGKKIVVQFLVGQEGPPQFKEVQTFAIPIEGEFCATSSTGKVYFSGEDQTLFSFQAAENTKAPAINTISEVVEVAGLAVYFGQQRDWLMVAHDEDVDVYTTERFEMVTSMKLSGIEDLSIEGGLSIYQGAFTGYQYGALAFAFEGEENTGVAVGSLEPIFNSSNIKPNLRYDPRSGADRGTSFKPSSNSVSEACSFQGFAAAVNASAYESSATTCECFAGASGDDCSVATCPNDCSSHGSCVSPNVCECSDSWTGPDCSFLAIQPRYETDANGGDGDDPAIWISPGNDSDVGAQSRIITTTKSSEGAGLAVFTLQGEFLQRMPAGEPNNVDVIYSLSVGDRKVDLAYAACRDDNTLCLFEISTNGTLRTISGGSQPVPEDYDVYGSCTYRSSSTGKQYLFVNSKEALYLQYELSATANGTLTTTLVRSFIGGSGGQVEGCVADEENGYLFLGEEPAGLWRYDAEPSAGNDTVNGTQIAAVDSNTLWADVEGVALVYGRRADEGYILVSSQGASAFVVYERRPPHQHVLTFTVMGSEDGQIDHVSNTDGLTLVGKALGKDFPGGLLVTHDDANELPDGSTAEEASFKIVGLRDIFGAEAVASLKLLEQVDEKWDPRAL